MTCFGFVELVDACDSRSDEGNDGMTVRSYTRSHSDLLCHHSNDCPTIFPVNVSQIHNVSRMSLKWLLYTLTCLRIPDLNRPIVQAREGVFVVESRALVTNKGHQIYKIKAKERIKTNLTDECLVNDPTEEHPSTLTTNQHVTKRRGSCGDRRSTDRDGSKSHCLPSCRR